MASPLVATKLHAPRSRGTLVPRPRLSALVDAGAEAALTLLSAPAGFGKSTVLASWLARSSTEPRAVASVSLDESDAQASSFWLYVVTAVHAAAPGVGASVLPLLTAGQPATRTLLTAVLNDIATQDVEVDLVLDDYHLADGAEVAEGMTFLLERRPPNLHVVLSTRADPDLPLARLRARGELVEIRARDLRFTVEETSAYLTDVGGLAVAPADVAALESRTEGWAAALQLAALSLQGRGDVAGFITGFTGTDRHVVDYLVDEVLSRQTDEVRDFLTRTSILDPLGADLCDAVLERTGGRRMLETLERSNLFLLPLDDQRRWYRYHHLFADVLRSHLRHEHPDEVAELHLRASRWYDEKGEPVPAVRHALAGGDIDRAADLAEAALPALQRDRQEATIRGWLGSFPVDVVRARPVLALGFVGALMSSNEFSDVEPRLRAVEEQLPAIQESIAARQSAATAGSPASAGADVRGVVAVDEGELARVPSGLELYRAGMSLVAGDLAATHRHAQLAIDASRPDDDIVRAGASGLSGLAHWACGELDDAHRRYTECIDGLRRGGHVSDVLGCTITVADIRIAQGRPRDGRASIDQALRLTAADTAPRGVADMHLALSQLALDRGRLNEARDQIEIARGLGDELGLPQFPYRSRVAAAMLAAAEGDVSTALALVAEAQQVYLGDFSPDVRPLHALTARLHVRLGDLDSAVRWAAEHDLVASQELSYIREYEHVTLAEVLLAQERHSGSGESESGVGQLLERLGAAAESGSRVATVIDVVILQAAVADARGQVEGALQLLRRAVDLAEPEAQVQAFARHGALLTPLLEELVRREPARPWIAELRDACLMSVTSPSGVAPASAPSTATVVEPLSVRELDVLRMLDTDLDGPEIAAHLFVSLNTVRTHTKSIYTKLGVNNRRAAVRRGRELGLLTVR